MRKLKLLLLVSTQAGLLWAQAEAEAIVPSLGATRSEVAASLGKPFQKGRFTDADDEVRLDGVPTGLWDIFHLTTHGRMYVSMIHFASEAGGVDGMMLELNGHWNIRQILSDQPRLAAICADECDIFRLTSPKQESSLLLRSHTGRGAFDLYFPGDTAEIVPRWRYITSLESEPEWVFVVQSTQTDSRHLDWKRELVGRWKPNLQETPTAR
jgi:hypothetical protein